jgi:hypothetical protein
MGNCYLRREVCSIIDNVHMIEAERLVLEKSRDKQPECYRPGKSGSAERGHFKFGACATHR